uniref:hypothetical protein n=1 Tax=Bradyrhizobium altum TaxID=1571202 RepID=UPI0028A27A72
MASHVSIGCQHVRTPLTCNDGSDNPHAGCACDIRDHMMELQIHLHQGLLHMLDIGGGIFHEPLPLAQ